MKTSLGAFFCLLTAVAFSQPSPDYTHFEVAAVRPATPNPNLPPGRVPAPTAEGGPGTSAPQRITYKNYSSWDLVSRAFDISPPMQVALPPASRSGLYDISVTLPPDATKAQVRTMLQNFLKERFHLLSHHETRPSQVYAMTVAKSGLKLKESSTAPAPAAPGTTYGGLDKEGFIQLPPDFIGAKAMPTAGRLRITAQKITIADLGGLVQSPRLGHPIVDQTKLTGLYDFKLEIEWMGQPAGDALDAPPTVFQALDQIGLKLELKELPFDVLVVDQIDKEPTGN